MTLAIKAQHRQVTLLLPWYVNSTLDQPERSTVERHLEICEECRRLVTEERSLAEALTAHQPAPVMPHATHFAALMRRIDRADGSVSRRWLDSLLAAVEGTWLGWRRAPRGMRLAVVAQAGAILVLMSLVRVEWRQRQEPSFETLAAPSAAMEPATQSPVAPSDWWHLRIVFAESLSPFEIDALIHDLQGERVDGPSTLGVYTIRLRFEEAGAAEELLDSLRQRDEVRFVEPVQPLRPRTLSP